MQVIHAHGAASSVLSTLPECRRPLMTWNQRTQQRYIDAIAAFIHLPPSDHEFENLQTPKQKMTSLFKRLEHSTMY